MRGSDLLLIERANQFAINQDTEIDILSNQ